MDMDYTLVCEENFDGMMTAVYNGWILMNKGNSVHIHPGEIYEYNFLTNYIDVQTDLNKAVKVADSIKKKISNESYIRVYRACMHYREDRVDRIVDYLKIGYRIGRRIDRDYGEPAVMEVMELAKKVANEVHLFKGFVRFSEIRAGDKTLLFSKISPKCDVITMLAHHFEGRYPLENWAIYDDVRQKALVHRRGSSSIIVSGNELDSSLGQIAIKDEYEELWKIFFQTIGIESRKNEKCQMNHMPKWYRTNMTEMQ